MKPIDIGRALGIFALVACAAAFAGCRKQEAASSAKARVMGETHETRPEAAPHALYRCPMHPRILRKEPGSCPICGMTLVPVEDGDVLNEPAGGEDSAAPIVRVAAATARDIGLRTRRVERGMLARTLRLDGKVVPDESRLRSVTARVGGYAEVVRVQSVGQAVRRGEVLLEMYSPEVAAAQARLLQPGGEAEARERLANWDVPASFTARVAKTGRTERRFPVIAPGDGVILRREVIAGEAVNPGMELYRTADLSTVWVTARVYAPDLAWIRKGARATLRFPNLPGETFASEVFFVAPEADAATRTVEIRMAVRNTRELDLKPELFAEVTLEERISAPTLVVPSRSLIRSGTRTLAVVATGDGRYQPREVVAGREAAGRTEILQGLSEGDEVVEAAQFLVDAESNLRAAVERLRAQGADEKGAADSRTGIPQGGADVR